MALEERGVVETVLVLDDGGWLEDILDRPADGNLHAAADQIAAGAAAY